MADGYWYHGNGEYFKVKHGRWIWKDHYLVCSECGEENDRTNYCPNCGAKMDLDEVKK